MTSLKQKCDNVARLLKVLSHPQRLLILCCLVDGEKTVSDLESMCEASQSGVSQFLKNMRLENLVESRRDGQFVYYKITDKKVLELMKSLHRIF